METRKITIVTTVGSQANHVINTDATTLGELKAALDANHINYTDMSFFEGLTHTELVDDAALLPHDVPYKGTVTNELLFMLTTANKKTKSGAGDRAALYDAIVAENLQDAVMQAFGKNFTQCKNSELEEIIAANTPADPSERVCPLAEAFKVLVEALYDEDVISEHTYDTIVSKMSTPVDGVYSQAEIDEIFSFVR